MNESLEENEFLILAILSLKKVKNRSARPFLDPWDLSVVQNVRPACLLESLAFSQVICLIFVDQ